MPGLSKRYKNPLTLGEPFRHFRNQELEIERARAKFCYFQHKIEGKTLREIAKSQGVSHERVRVLARKAQYFFGVSKDDYKPPPPLSN